MWSQCVWLMSMWPLTGRFLFLCDISWCPSEWPPVPQSTTISVPLSERISTQDVLPPYLVVVGPGFAIEPRVPQN